MSESQVKGGAGITIVGLGAGPFGYLTVETLETLRKANCLYLRTAIHPAVAGLKERKISFQTFDEVYESGATFEEVYRTIVDRCLAKARQGEDVVYAVPGSPLVAEQTVVLLREAAEREKIPLKILPGMSFLEVLYARLGIDPLNGISILDADALNENLLLEGEALVIAQVYDQRLASDTKLALMDYYPDDYPVIFIHNLGLPDEELRKIPLYELDRQPKIDHLTSLFVPARKTKIQPFSLAPLADVMARLRSPGGCVWDLEQTHQSLRRYLVEEVYEILEAIDQKDSKLLCEELGDLLLQIIFHARVAEEYEEFSLQDVVDRVTEKMVRRHPHVFGDISVKDAAEVLVNWDKIKQQEKPGERPSCLDGVSPGLPALMRAFKLQGKAAKVGFDWPDVAPVWDKLAEEIKEFKEAVEQEEKPAMEDELGDVLFAVVNLARFLGIEPETALNHTNNKFRRRFQFIEEKVKKQGLNWEKLTLKELDCYWDEAKSKESR